MEKTFLLKGLDCPYCSVIIEKEIGDIEGVNSSSINLIKQTLTVNCNDVPLEKLFNEVEKIVHKYEPKVGVFEYVEEILPKKEVESKEFDSKIKVIRLVFGAVLFALGIILSELTKAPLPISISVFIVAYLILGFDVVLKAIKNIAKGRVFDENFLMSLSTIGAFIISEYPEAVAVMLFYQIGEFFQTLAVNRSRKSITALMDIRPDSATVVKDGEQLVVSPETVSIGDVIVVKPGEKIPLDGVVISGESMLDVKALTGESVPKTAREGDEVFSGSINQSGVLTIKVSKFFGESTVSKIINLVENASSRKAPSENFITTFARYYTPIVVILALILAVVPPLFFDGAWVEWIRRAFVFLVVSCPCALVISIPLAFFGGIGSASRHGILVKGSNYLEALNNLDTIVFDKTGTLTKGVFNVSEIIPANGFSREQILEYTAMAEYYSNHPIAKSIISAYNKDLTSLNVLDYHQISGQGVSAVVNNSKILVGNGKLLTGKGIEYTPCDNVGTKVYVAIDSTFAGCIIISDELKKDSKDAIRTLKQKFAKKTVMLTGDDEEIAKSISNEIDIDEYYAQLLPDQKVEILERLDKNKKVGSKIAFVGDGVNDAPALARADIGIAMGGLGSDATIEVADVVLMTDEPSKLAKALEIAKATKRIVLQNIVIALTVKGVLLILGALGISGMWEAVFGDVGVALIAVLNSMRIMKK